MKKDNIKDGSLIDSLKKVNVLYRIPLYLYYYEGYNIEEISKIMKLSISNTKQRLSRGRDLLKGELEDEYE
jgi:RNA polymerase sigma-70 factor (ECF subfamily)